MIANTGTIYLISSIKGNYIGSTSDFINRMRVHKHLLPQIHNLPWEEWKVQVLLERPDFLKLELREIEKLLIQIYKPSLNRYYKKSKVNIDIINHD